MKKFFGIVAALVVAGIILIVGIMALIGGAANEVAKEIDAGSGTDSISAEEVDGATGGGERYTWKDLQVERDEFGSFAGALTITNDTDEAAEVFVEVTVYDGEQTLGTLNGSSRVKPGATSRVDLTSLDDFAKGATDYEVEVSGF